MEEIKYIKRCIEIAEKGIGNVAPNPMVGCVIVNDGKIIAEGFHMEFGGPHAEVIAINSITDKNIFKYSVLFVNLEPCSHYGKTPPCAEFIIKTGIPKVVIGSIDLFKKVAGKGIQMLKDAGIEVITGIMEEECEELNKRFFTFHKKNRPYIILKWAQSSDGFIGIKNEIQSQSQRVWLTDDKLKSLVHKWRTEEQAIMIGTNTAQFDNPQLNVREWNGKNPLRIVLDKNLRLPETLNMFDETTPTLILTSKKIEKKNSNNLEFIQIDFNRNIIKQLCDILYEKDIQSLFVEGGTKLLQTFIDEGLWDEARVFTGNTALIDGIKAPEIKGKIISETFFHNDKLTYFRNYECLKKL